MINDKIHHQNAGWGCGFDITFMIRIYLEGLSSTWKGSNTIEEKVVIVDDLIATGGTIEAIVKLVEQLGGEVVKIVFVMELEGLEGRKKLEGYDVEAAIKYEGK